MSNTLLFASKSLPRRKLLEQAKIPFVIIEQDADERQCDWSLPFPKLLEAIAVHKMDHAILSHVNNDKEQFVITVDTMLQSHHGTILGKPTHKDAAIEMIKESRHGGVVGTAFCLDKKRYFNNQWNIDQRIVKYVQASYILDFPDYWIERYFEQFPDYLTIAGALNIEEFGMQFLKSLNGSYSTAIGLPLYELREALESLGFF